MRMEKKILILEDEKDIAQIYVKRLKAKGYDLELASDGLEGLEKLKNFKPDLILLDLSMPKLGGLGFYQKICNGQDRPQYSVLVLTGRNNMEELLIQMNVDGFIAKPFGIDELLCQVDAILEKRSNRDGQAADKEESVAIYLD
jgi:DNA-binding response OmpR family regulator